MTTVSPQVESDPPPLLERLEARAVTFVPEPGVRSDANADRLAAVVASWKTAA